MGVPKYQGLTRKSGGRSVWTGKVATDHKALEAPVSWKKPRNVFVNSMADLFHQDVPTDFIQKVWGVMEKASQHTYQILTKRPERMAELTSSGVFKTLPNVWLGTSVEDGRVLDRIDHLRQVKSVVRFISFEPLIGSVSDADLSGIHWAIVGGESGPVARPMQTEWVDEIEQLCRKAGAAFFFKQWGGRNKKSTGRLYRGQTFDEMPALVG